jgi:anti-sigma factor RsiW
VATKTIADETLMAFADGQLAPDEAARVAAAAASDLALAARVEQFAQSRRCPMP